MPSSRARRCERLDRHARHADDQQHRVVGRRRQTPRPGGRLPCRGAEAEEQHHPAAVEVAERRVGGPAGRCGQVLERAVRDHVHPRGGPRPARRRAAACPPRSAPRPRPPRAAAPACRRAAPRRTSRGSTSCAVSTTRPRERAAPAAGRAPGAAATGSARRPRAAASQPARQAQHVERMLQRLARRRCPARPGRSTRCAGSPRGSGTPP